MTENVALFLLYAGALLALVCSCVWCVRECLAEGGLDVEKREQHKPWRTRILGNVALGIFGGVVIFTIPAFLMSMLGSRYASAIEMIAWSGVSVAGWVISLRWIVRLGRRMISRRRALTKELRS